MMRLDWQRTNHHAERNYLNVLLEFEIAVELYKHIAHIVSRRRSSPGPDADPAIAMNV